MTNTQILNINLTAGKSIFFASDFHLGTHPKEKSDIREQKIVDWLNSISQKAGAIFLVGDIFDFWFEYPHVIPRGYSKFLATIQKLRDQNIPIYFFTGNHDMWMFDYFPTQFGIPVFYDPIKVIVNDKTSFLVGHGDGLGKGDYSYKFLKLFFKNKFCQSIFRWTHPTISIGLARTWSQKSRLSHGVKEEIFMGDKEYIWQYCKDLNTTENYQYYVFGHRHLVLDLPVGDKSKYFNLGEWISQCNYLEFDGNSAQLIKFDK